MKHLVIADYGTFLGLDNHRLRVRAGDDSRHFPLSRLATISIAKRGVSLSSDLVEALSARGIKLFFLDFRGVAHSALIGESQHGVVAVRLAQMKFFESESFPVASQIIIGKIKNQRATLNYLNKYHGHATLSHAAETLLECAGGADGCKDVNTLLGFEGRHRAPIFKHCAKRDCFLHPSSAAKAGGARKLTTPC